MTELLYLKDAYIRECSANIIEIITNGGRCFVILDRTIFYPQGGGQVYDLGKIIYNDKEYNILSVKKSEEKIFHEVDKLGLNIGNKIICKVDWGRRYKLMRSHTATHILAETIFKETGALITGNQIEVDKCRIDFDLKNNNQELIKTAIEKANNVIKKNLPIKIDFILREEANKIPQLSKLAKGLPENLNEIRIVSIGDFDIQADGGTHVNNTKEIGKIIFLKVDNRGKNNRRVYFEVK